MSILVTGSSGMIGTRLCQVFREKDIRFIGLDARENKWDAKVEAVTKRIDLLKLEELLKLNEPIEMIIHLASRARVITSIEDPTEGLENMTTTFNILDFARQKNIKKILLASSKEVYGLLPKAKAAEHSIDPRRCENPYSASKLASEALFFSYKNSYGIEPLVLRFSNVYGKYDINERIIPLLIRKAITHGEITIFGKEKKLDFIYSDDIVEGIFSAVQKFDQVKNDIYNLGYGKSFALLNVAKLIQKILQKEIKISVEPNRPGEIMEFSADITKSQHYLNFQPKISLEEGLRRTIFWQLETYFPEQAATLEKSVNREQSIEHVNL
jgi:nucleoside-diphosphate-sugar epimerase